MLDLPELIGGRVRLRAMARWLDEPGLKFFGVGVFSTPSDEISYGLRSTDVGVEVAGRAGRWLGYGVGVGYLDARSSDGSESPSIGSRPASEIPGQGADATWLRTSVFAAVDTRRSPGYTNRGGLYSVSFHDYEDRGRAFGFTRTDVDLRQFVPLLQSNWIIALQARAQIAAPSSGDVVPFFMLPTVGGRDTLPGFEDHRFADRVSLLLRSELRWTASPLVDMAVFVDHGTVSPRLQDLRLADLQRGWGMGARLHSSTTTFLRIEAVKSVEGWRYNLAQGVSF